jgi:anti-sigma factor RsiW
LNVAMNEDDDALLVAWLDGELNAAEREALDARLAAEPLLSARLSTLREATANVDEGFDALLAAAPLDRLRGRLAGALATPALARRVSPFALRAAAAAAVVFVFAAGLATGRWSGESSTNDNWRSSVAEYMELYTGASFGADASPTLAEDLAMLSQRLGAPLDGERLQLAGLSLRRAELLQYDGAPLGQIGYLDGTTPVAFCVTRDGEADAPLATSQRDGFAIAQWAKDGRGFMLIGKIAPERLADFARQLQGKTG